MTERYELGAAKKAITPPPRCAGGPVSHGPATTPGATDLSPSPERKEKSSVSSSRTFLRTREGTYGYRRIQAYLDRRGVRVDGATIRSIMRELSLEAAQPRAKVRTTVPAEDLDERPDLVGQDFTADEPGRKWCGDITYINTWAGFVYLATVLDC